MYARGPTFDLSKVWCLIRRLADAKKSAPVIRRERFYQNPFGLFDTSGNVNQ